MFIQYNMWGSTGSGVNFVLSFLFISFFYSSHIFPSPSFPSDVTTAAIRWWNLMSKIIHMRHCFYCCDISYYMLGRVLIYWMVLCERGRLIHQIWHLNSTKWDTIHIFSSNIPDLVLPHIYCQHPHHTASLLFPLSSSASTILHLFCYLHCLTFLTHIF